MKSRLNAMPLFLLDDLLNSVTKALQHVIILNKTSPKVNMKEGRPKIV